MVVNASRSDHVRVVHEGRDDVGEGLWWSIRENAVLWVDIIGQRLSRLSLDASSITEWAVPATIGWVVEREHHRGFIAGLGRDIVELSLDPLKIRCIVSLEPDMAQNRLNDAVVDAAGRLWVGTMPISGDRLDGALYRLDPDHRIVQLDRGYHVTNGPAFSGDRQTLYHADSPLGLVYRCAVNDDGSLAERVVHIRFASDWGLPDGMTTDADGCLWIAHWGGGRVSRFDPYGQLMTSIALPASQITNCVFAGTTLDRMFVTSARLDRDDEPLAGALFEIDPGVKGMLPYRYGG